MQEITFELITFEYLLILQKENLDGEIKLNNNLQNT